VAYLFLVRRMRTLLCLCVLFPVTTLRCEPPASKPATGSRPELAIVAVTVQLDISVEVTDADTGAPIRGVTVELVRSGDGKELAPVEARNAPHAATTNDRGVAHLDAAFGGHSVTGGWVEAFTGNSFVAVKAPKYVASRAFVSTPSGRLEISGPEQGKVAVQHLDKLSFHGDETRRKVLYHVTLHRDKNA
jgi:hypothetical protein